MKDTPEFSGFRSRHVQRVIADNRSICGLSSFSFPHSEPRTEPEQRSKARGPEHKNPYGLTLTLLDERYKT